MPYNDEYTQTMAHVLEYDQWVSYPEFYTAIVSTIQQGTQTLAQRETALASIRATLQPALYAQEKRFPERGVFVCLGFGVWKILGAKLLSGLQSRARYHDDRGTGQEDTGSDSASESRFRSLQDSARSLEATLHTILEHLRNRAECFTRDSFESRYHLVWANPN